ncbi:unnamed protein product [Adineta ricciae]|uniref:WSC domain-containing protein n=1 Tax=Adineta ricciae TaxID=249248 RepID=A0A813YLQ4_ADIRI|nr:unnamed protein product [Adineta ricciae]
MTLSQNLFLLIIFSTYPAIHASYHYVGCYTQVFYDSFFHSSYMEPLLCFRLCDTPIVYLQKTICRCSGGGFMHYNRQNDDRCLIPCPKTIDSKHLSNNTCGGLRTYSVYSEQGFYSRHGHLFNYQIKFSSCESWAKQGIYDTIVINLNEQPIISSLNKLEQCAAVCLDRNITTKSIAFNNDENQCVCIMKWQIGTTVKRDLFVKTLSNHSCDYHCSNSINGSIGEQKFQCGSTIDKQIWAIYDIHGTCPSDFIYIKELNKCMNTFEFSWNSCSPPSISYIYNGNITWDVFLQIVERLGLKNSKVAVHFTQDIVIDSSLLCAKSSIVDTSSLWSSQSFTYSTSSGLTKRYILEKGCLVNENTQQTFSYRYANYLCVAEPLNQYTTSYDIRDSLYSFINEEPEENFCPPQWLDLNGRCYRMSSERKSIQDAKSSCIALSKTTTTQNSALIVQPENNDTDDDDGLDDQLNFTPKGDIVQYTSPWQARLGFFLLDKIPDADEQWSDQIATQKFNVYYEDLALFAIDAVSNQDFQMISPIENNAVNITDDSCIVLSRTEVKPEERPVLKATVMSNCSIPRHVLCETKTLIVDRFQKSCFRKPVLMDLPALISNHLTHELCLTICEELQTTLVIIHINKCYCLNDYALRPMNFTNDLSKYQRTSCGQLCSGNRHEQCGDNDTIVVFDISQSRRAYSYYPTTFKPYLDFSYDSCVHMSSFDPNRSYKFTFNDSLDLHPRHCLEFCTINQQKYALINSNQCFCMNMPAKHYNNKHLLPKQHCSQECSSNYFYTCGNPTSSTIYSVYTRQQKCRHGFEMAQNREQCVYGHYSTRTYSYESARSNCDSLGSSLVKINDVLELQDLLPRSMVYTHVFLWNQLANVQASALLNFSKYFWLDRTTDKASDPIDSSRLLLTKCSQSPPTTDGNCFALSLKKTPSISELCVIESDECTSKSATPICVNDQSKLNYTSNIHPWKNDNSTVIATNISMDYSCDDNQKDYHFIDEYCYKITFHETTWSEAKSTCEKENAIVFVPETHITLSLIRSLFIRRTNYIASGYAHVGVKYDTQNRTVIESNINNKKVVEVIPDSNAIYDLCEKTFHERYTALMSSTTTSSNEREQMKTKQMGCAYVDLLSDTMPLIRCDEIPCDRIATVICQKLPIVKQNLVKVKREEIPTFAEIGSRSGSLPSQMSSLSWDNSKSVLRDFAPILCILALLCIFLLLGLINMLHNHNLLPFVSYVTRRQNINLAYTPLTLTSEFDVDCDEILT